MLDRIGIIISFGCMVHCIVTPVILPLLPMLGFLIGHDSDFHLILSGVITLVAGLALIPGYLKHKDHNILISAFVGITAIIGAGILEHSGQHGTGIFFITMCGSVLIILSHYFNHKLICRCNHHNH